MNFNAKLSLNLLVPSFALTICTGVVQAACIPGDCTALGYTKNESNCEGDIIRCPFDTTKVFCKDKTLDDTCPDGYKKVGNECVKEEEDCSQYKKSPWAVNGSSMPFVCKEYDEYWVPSSTSVTCGGIKYTRCGICEGGESCCRSDEHFSGDISYASSALCTNLGKYTYNVRAVGQGYCVVCSNSPKY